MTKSTARFSFISETALTSLASTEGRLAAIEGRVAEIGQLAGQAVEGQVGELKAELAQLESEAKQLETTGVDEVYTGELNSGKTLAKATKKGMLQRLEALFSQCDEIFQVLKGGTAR